MPLTFRFRHMTSQHITTGYFSQFYLFILCILLNTLTQQSFHLACEIADSSIVQMLSLLNKTCVLQAMPTGPQMPNVL